MIDKNVVKKLVDEWLQDQEYFLVDIEIIPDNRIVVEIDHVDGVWIEDFDFNGKDIIESKITVELFENLFNTLMDDNYVLTYCDEAYRPYISPSIYIY